MKFDGLVIGIAAFIIIGVFHPIIIKCEYYFSEKIWPVFLITGIVMIALSCFFQQIVISAIFAILGCTCLWSIVELKEQTRRVRKGWFPENPKHAAHRINTGDRET